MWALLIGISACLYTGVPTVTVSSSATSSLGDRGGVPLGRGLVAGLSSQQERPIGARQDLLSTCGTPDEHYVIGDSDGDHAFLVRRIHALHVRENPSQSK